MVIKNLEPCARVELARLWFEATDSESAEQGKMASTDRVELSLSHFAGERPESAGVDIWGAHGRIRTYTNDGRNIVPIQLGDVRV